LVPICALQGGDPGVPVFLVVFKIWCGKAPFLEAAYRYAVEVREIPDGPIDG